MQIQIYQLGPLQTNCYLLYEGGQAVVIDPGGSPNPVIATLLQEKQELEAILLTHLHFDHIYGVKSLMNITNTPVYAANEDRPLLRSPYGKGGIWGMPEVEIFNYTSLPVGEEMTFMSTACRILSTPGHTPGGVSFYFPAQQVVFTGDALFKRSIGRTDFPGGDQQQLLSSIETQLFTLPGETVVYSGHGEPSTIGDERLHNPMFEDNI